MNLLKGYLQEKTQQNFEWGVCDCILFVCDWCEKATGINPAQGAHGKYNSELTAYLYLGRRYNNDPASHFDLHFKRVDCTNSQIGDVVMCAFEEKETFGICCANDMVAFKMQKGIVYKKDMKKLACWRVECQ